MEIIDRTMMASNPIRAIAKLRTCSISVLSALVAASSWAAVIDDFDSGPITLTRESEPVTFEQSGLDPLRVIGGSRRFVLGEFGADNQLARIEDGALSLELGDPAAGLAYLRLQYGSESEPLSVDLTADGSDRFVAEDLIGANSVLRVGSPTGQSAASFRPSQPYVRFSDFTPTNFTPGADFTNLSWIQLDVHRSTGFSIGPMRTAPEPCSSGMALIVIAWAYTRRLHYIN